MREYLLMGTGPNPATYKKRQTTTITQWTGKVRTQGKYQCGLSAKLALDMTPLSSRYLEDVLRWFTVLEVKPNLMLSVVRWETT